MLDFFDSLRKAAFRRLSCQKSGKATFLRKLRCALRLGCPLKADNSTPAPRNVFSATHRSRQKTDHIAFASADAKLCEAFQQAEKGGFPPPFSVSLE